MLALCLMLSVTHYAQNYAGIIGRGPYTWLWILILNVLLETIVLKV